MKKYLTTLFLPVIAVLLLGSCSAKEDEMSTNGSDQTCMPVGDALDMQRVDSFKKLVINEPDVLTGNDVKYGVIEWINYKVNSVVRNASFKIFWKISTNIEFRNTLALMITLSIIFFTVSMMLGITQASGYNALIFVLKLLVIYNLAVNYLTFNQYVISLFEDFVSDIIAFSGNIFHNFVNFETQSLCNRFLPAGNVCDYAKGVATMLGLNGVIDNLTNDLFGSSLFGDVSDIANNTIFREMDKYISMLWDFRYIKLVMALMLTGVTGLFWGAMMLLFIWSYLAATILTVKTYLMALIGRYVLYGLGPIFLSFALFSQTRSLFDGWLQQLINFTLQPIFLFIFLGMFLSIMGGFVNEMYIKPIGDLHGTSSDGVKSQPMCVKYGPIDDKSSLNWYRLCYTASANGQEKCSGSIKPIIPIDIWMVIASVIMCYVMGRMCRWVVDVAAQISAGTISLGDVKIQGLDRLKSGASQSAKSLFAKGTAGGSSAPRH